MSVTIKPCPFCGEPATSGRYKCVSDKWRIACDRPNSCPGGYIIRDTEKEAINIWNIRMEVKDASTRIKTCSTEEEKRQEG